MAYRKKKPSINLSFLPSSSSLGPPSSSSDATPYTSNLPPSRYEDNNSGGGADTGRSSLSSRDDDDSVSNLPSPLEASASSTTYRSPDLGLSIGSDYVRIHSMPAASGKKKTPNSLESTLQIKSSKPWSTHLKHLKPLGRGQCSTVYKSILLPSPVDSNPPLPPESSRKYYATKSVQSYDNEKTSQILKEIGVLSRLSCPCLVSFEGAYFKDRTLSLVLEYMSCGSLENYIGGSIPLNVIAGISYQILYGLSYLHWYKLTHRDIKPANVLLSSSGQVKIGDFGIASGRGLKDASGDSLNSTVVGTGMYMSGERLRGKKYKSTCDIWSFGITVLEMSFGRHPFHGMGTVEIVMTIDEWDGRVSNLMGRMEEPGLEELVGLCLAKEEKRRLPAELLLESPWLKERVEGVEQASGIVRRYLMTKTLVEDEEEKDMDESMAESLASLAGMSLEDKSWRK
ncbi:hypothetical protein TrST_g5476 [Triparma strigata]|uniref:mitogen-activated protein kinase kinase n=2 Tax=Triparma TaxID=722752 RepID=A0A9W7BQD7_9STRA|nr:hypothetical protein TrST_g5476 [Triparma strigata]|mmetsp:Transcript_17951/g.33369  ORF Transcript_17951/g.33369 Transcript_17951/m.33369 type:complete len:455 (-) Transcript_17951:51-1415(-)|eukprot:CAMPEP_0182497656 /NCGR_PEP_ID=MMETSP1321-20130603/6078_1 /TAXON_ID=91990 /ORGANISM="Bolidomonas sp., Strain RCC1657" /LENGTH=454 /DNA_ID=CAMNT_0024701581 /DNA_START=98 /DNA_END=1462 /DNA_ORIENTATION=-